MNYQGSPKHKLVPGRGSKGTLCPDWTHQALAGGLGSKLDGHPWPQTEAQQLLDESEPCPRGKPKRYATARGIAFAAQETMDGVWHGYPVPWGEVPDELKNQWQDKGLVRGRDLQRYSDRQREDIRWALETDED